jgi:hypothetical protein
MQPNRRPTQHVLRHGASTSQRGQRHRRHVRANGLCLNTKSLANGTSVPQYWRSSCTDPTWESPYCLKDLCFKGNDTQDDVSGTREPGETVLTVYSGVGGMWQCTNARAIPFAVNGRTAARRATGLSLWRARLDRRLRRNPRLRQRLLRQFIRRRRVRRPRARLPPKLLGALGRRRKLA